MPSLFDAKEVILFDIDGTLVDVTPLHVKAYEAAFQRVAGVRIRDSDHLIREWGKPEAEVMASVLRTYGTHNPPKELIPKLIKAYTQNVVRFSSEISPKNVLPGVKALLQRLKRQGKTLVAVSGNPKKIGDALLKHTGLMPFFDATAYSTERFNRRPIQYRHQIVELGMQRASINRGKKIELARTLVVGDTPSDIAAAQKVGIDSLVVSTGRYSLATLKSHGPTYYFATLADSKVLKRRMPVVRTHKMMRRTVLPTSAKRLRNRLPI